MALKFSRSGIMPGNLLDKDFILVKKSVYFALGRTLVSESSGYIKVLPDIFLFMYAFNIYPFHLTYLTELLGRLRENLFKSSFCWSIGAAEELCIKTSF